MGGGHGGEEAALDLVVDGPPRGADAPPGDAAAALEARVRELMLEQDLMQRELDHMTEMAQRSDAQLR